VRIGGGGAYQPQFTNHMYLPVQAERMDTEPATPAEPTADAAAPLQQAPVIDLAAHLPAAPEALGPAELPPLPLPPAPAPAELPPLAELPPTPPEP
jgi:hypothetical protein